MNIAGLLLQLFVVSRVLKYLGVRVAILVLPLIALGGYLVAAFYPVLAIVRWVKTAENATDYSLQNTVRQVLFLPTTREQKYKAKQAIDTFFRALRRRPLRGAGVRRHDPARPVHPAVCIDQYSAGLRLAGSGRLIGREYRAGCEHRRQTAARC